jgi:hypothetical protein
VTSIQHCVHSSVNRSARRTDDTRQHGAPHIPALIPHASVSLSSSSFFSRDVHSSTSLALLQYLHRSYSDANDDHIVVVNTSHSAYICNNIVAGALFVMLQRRLGNFPVFFLSSLLFLSLVCSPLHPSSVDHSESSPVEMGLMCTVLSRARTRQISAFPAAFFERLIRTSIVRAIASDEPRVYSSVCSLSSACALCVVVSSSPSARGIDPELVRSAKLRSGNCIIRAGPVDHSLRPRTLRPPRLCPPCTNV